eukprot:gene12335-2251_t
MEKVEAKEVVQKPDVRKTYRVYKGGDRTFKSRMQRLAEEPQLAHHNVRALPDGRDGWKMEDPAACYLADSGRLDEGDPRWDNATAWHRVRSKACYAPPQREMVGDKLYWVVLLKVPEAAAMAREQSRKKNSMRTPSKAAPSKLRKQDRSKESSGPVHITGSLTIKKPDDEPWPDDESTFDASSISSPSFAASSQKSTASLNQRRTKPWRVRSPAQPSTLPKARPKAARPPTSLPQNLVLGCAPSSPALTHHVKPKELPCGAANMDDSDEDTPLNLPNRKPPPQSKAPSCPTCSACFASQQAVSAHRRWCKAQSQGHGGQTPTNVLSTNAAGSSSVVTVTSRAPTAHRPTASTLHSPRSDSSASPHAPITPPGTSAFAPDLQPGVTTHHRTLSSSADSSITIWNIKAHVVKGAEPLATGFSAHPLFPGLNQTGASPDLVHQAMSPSPDDPSPGHDRSASGPPAPPPLDGDLLEEAEQACPPYLPC